MNNLFYLYNVNFIEDHKDCSQTPKLNINSNTQKLKGVSRKLIEPQTEKNLSKTLPKIKRSMFLCNIQTLECGIRWGHRPRLFISIYLSIFLISCLLRKSLILTLQQFFNKITSENVSALSATLNQAETRKDQA